MSAGGGILDAGAGPVIAEITGLDSVFVDTSVTSTAGFRLPLTTLPTWDDVAFDLELGAFALLNSRRSLGSGSLLVAAADLLLEGRIWLLIVAIILALLLGGGAVGSAERGGGCCAECVE
jgi:hypothetical protein